LSGEVIFITTITSYELDRKTGATKQACKAGPVFITKHKHVTHVLLTVEDFEKLPKTAETPLARLKTG
jgi:hypothetical protein